MPKSVYLLAIIRFLVTKNDNYQTNPNIDNLYTSIWFQVFPFITNNLQGTIYFYVNPT